MRVCQSVPMRQPSQSPTGTVEGQKFKLKDLLYSLMLESHNDTAVMLAEHLAGSVEQFADEMNQKARELGLSHTHFVTPNGLDGQMTAGASDHGRRTGKDYALLCDGVSKAEGISGNYRRVFLSVFGSGADADVFLHQSQRVSYDDGRRCIRKTGFTGEAGYWLRGALKEKSEPLS